MLISWLLAELFTGSILHLITHHSRAPKEAAVFLIGLFIVIFWRLAVSGAGHHLERSTFGCVGNRAFCVMLSISACWLQANCFGAVAACSRADCREAIC